jgi:ferric iron reductase protein FhuF
VEARFAVEPAAPGWAQARDLTEPGQPVLEALLARWRTARSASAPVAASLLLLEYTRVLTWPALACALRQRTSLDPALDNVRLDTGSPRLRLGFVRGPRSGPPDVAEQVLLAVLDTHLDPLVAALRARTRAGRRTLWSNVAAGIAGGYLALSWTLPDRARHVDAARAAIDADPRLRGLVEVTVGEQGGAAWMRVGRRACCLAFRCAPPHAHFCGTCPLVDEAARRERFERAAAQYRELTADP